MKKFYLLLMLAFAGEVCALPAETLYAAVAERLSLMHDVAAYKWNHGLAIEDRQREQVVHDAALQQALNVGIKPATAKRFFEQQIAAAKDIQRYWFRQWADEPAPPSADDLQQVLRPRLLELGTQIVLGLGQPQAHDQGHFNQRLNLPGLSAQRRATLYAALLSVARYPNRLDQILETGILRVGTTGDYAPFSYRPAESSEANTRFHGIDIDLAHDLARSLDVALLFVHTSWPALSQDLSAGHFDIAMSGVSRTLPRARIGHLSIPYYVGGKMPIARCADHQRFSSLDAIDTAGVRVIVNPGGTNEQFVDKHLKHATKIVHADNRSIFHALSEGNADVMITDRIEVLLQVQNNPMLCATMTQTLSYQEKAYLMPADPHLKAYVDTWLSLRLGDGTVNTLLEQHLQ